MWPLKTITRKECPLLSLLFSVVMEFLKSIKERSKKNAKEKIKISAMTLYIERPKDLKVTFHF